MPCHFQNTQYSLELKMKILHSNDFTLYMKVPLEKCGGQPRSIYRLYSRDPNYRQASPTGGGQGT